MNSDKDLTNILNIIKEFKSVLKEIEIKEKIISEKIESNTCDILIYKAFLENVIEEFHLICKSIYK